MVHSLSSFSVFTGPLSALLSIFATKKDHDGPYGLSRSSFYAFLSGFLVSAFESPKGRNTPREFTLKPSGKCKET
jgi:hypothetical protein